MASVSGDAIALKGTTVKTAWASKSTTTWLRWSQFAVGLILIPCFRVFFNIKIVGREKIRTANTPVIIAANHVSFYDSFLFRMVAGYGMLPLRFMAVTRFDIPFLNFFGSVGIIKFIYSLFGVFTVVPGRGLNANLKEARSILASGSSVVIYPEGKINADPNTIAAFKVGTVVLAKQSSVSVLPIAFRIHHHSLLRRKISMRIGDELSFSDHLSVSDATNLLRSKISELFESLA